MLRSVIQTKLILLSKYEHGGATCSDHSQRSHIKEFEPGQFLFLVAFHRDATVHLKWHEITTAEFLPMRPWCMMHLFYLENPFLWVLCWTQILRSPYPSLTVAMVIERGHTKKCTVQQDAPYIG